MTSSKPADSAGNYFLAFIVVLLFLLFLSVIWFIVNIWYDFMYKALFGYIFCNNSLLHHLIITIVLAFIVSLSMPLYSSIEHDFDIFNLS